MKKEIKELLKAFEGNVLIIGFSKTSNELKEIDKNKKIVDYTHLSNENGTDSKGKRKLFGNKTISIKKMYKDLKKEKYDYILVEFEIIKKYLDSFIYNSYKLAKKKIYFILNDETYNYEELMYRYKRYNANPSSISYKNDYIITIELQNMKMNLYKRILYRIRDVFYDMLELIVSIIIS